MAGVSEESADALDELAARAAGGDAGALDDLLVAIEPRVKRIAGRMLLHPQDAEEAAQDALLAVARKIATLKGRSRFTTWLHAVASNSARSTYRSMKRRSSERSAEDLSLAADPRTNQRDRRQPVGSARGTRGVGAVQPGPGRALGPAGRQRAGLRRDIPVAGSSAGRGESRGSTAPGPSCGRCCG